MSSKRISTDAPRIGDRVKVVAVGNVANRPYIGKIGRLDWIARANGQPVSYDVEFKDDMIIASKVEKVTS